MATYIPGISASGTLAPGLTPAAVRAVLELLSAAEIAAAYLPLAGGTMAGDLDMDHYGIINVQSIDSDEITLNGLPVATEQFASNASNLTSGTVADARLSANVPLKNAANTFTANQTFGVAGTSNGQIVVGAAASVNAYITIAGSANNVVSGRNNILGVTWQIVTDASGSGGPASFRLGSTGSYGFGNASANVGTVDVSLVRNATGPTLETRAAGGLKVCNADGSALANLEARQGRFNGSNSVPPIVLRSSNAGWGGTISFGEGSTDYLNFTSSQNRIFLNGSGPLVLQNVAGTVGCSLDQSVDGTLSIRDRNASALASLNLANLTASGTVTAIGGLLLQSGATGCTITPHGGSILFKSNDLYPAKFIGASEFRQASTMALSWTNGTSFGGTVTSTLSQLSSGVLQVGTTGNNALGSLNLANLNSSGVAKFDGYPTSLLPAAASNAGGITYDTTLSKHVGCDGSSWNALW